MTFDYETGMTIIFWSCVIFSLVFLAACFGIAYCRNRYEIRKRDEAARQAEKAGLAVIVTAEDYMKLNAKDSKQYPINVHDLNCLYRGRGYIRILHAEYRKLYDMVITHGQDIQRANCQKVREAINKVLTEEGGAEQ